MPTLNKVFLLGNLTRDPDLRGLPSGQSVCEMRLAITRRYISNGKDVDETCFVDVVVWGKSANNCKQFLTKGSQIMVEGRCSGSIGYEPVGENGFGYDPIFMYGDQSFAQISADEKNKVSHRADALNKLIAELKELDL